MSVQILPTSKKYFRQLKNGDDFLLNPSDFSNELKGNISGKVRAEFEIEVSWRAVLENYTVEQFSGTDAVINLGSTNIFQSGFTVGDHASLIASDGQFFSEFDIASISQDGSILVLENVAAVAGFVNFSVKIYAGPSTLRGETPLLGAAYKTNIVTNDGITVFSNLIDQVEGTYNVDDLAIATPKNAIWGNVKKGSQTGGLTVEYVGAIMDGGTFNVGDSLLVANSERPSIQKYIFKEDLIAGPYFLQGEDGISTGLEPDRLDSTSLKHVVEFDLRHTLSQVNTSKVLRIDKQNDGVVNYYKGTYNDQPNQYSVSNVVIQDVTNSVSLDKIDVTVTTRINFRVNSALGTFTSGQALVLIHSMLPDASVYGNSTETFEETWITDHARHEMDGTGASFGVIQNFIAAFVDPNITDCQVDLIYDSDQQGKITEGDKYALTVELENDLLTTNTSDTTILPINVDTYLKNSDNPNIWFVDRVRFFTRPMTFTGAGIEDGFSQMKLWNQDSFMVDWAARLDRSEAEDGVITGLSVSIVAIHDATDDFFILDQVIYDLGNQTVVNGSPTIQNINIDESRGFRANAGDKVNFEKLQTGLLVGDDQNYTGQTGFIIPWQTWQKLQDADTGFLIATEPNDNLNKQTSNYSGLLNYNIKLIIEATVTDAEDATTRVIDKTPVCNVKNFFDQDGIPVSWTTQEQTFKLSGPNTNQTALKTEDTRLVFTFTPDVPFVIDGLLYYAEVRAEPVNNRGADYHYLTTFEEAPRDNILQPEDGQDFAKLDVTGCCIEISCLSSFENMDKLLDYNFYCKISLFDQTPPIIPTIQVQISGTAIQPDADFWVFRMSEVMTNAVLKDNFFNILEAGYDFKIANDATVGAFPYVKSTWNPVATEASFATLAAKLAIESDDWVYIEQLDDSVSIEGLIIEFERPSLGQGTSTFVIVMPANSIDQDIKIWSDRKYEFITITIATPFVNPQLALRTAGPTVEDWTEFNDFVIATPANFNAVLSSVVDGDKHCFHMFNNMRDGAVSNACTFEINYLSAVATEKDKEIFQGEIRPEYRPFGKCAEWGPFPNADDPYATTDPLDTPLLDLLDNDLNSDDWSMSYWILGRVGVNSGADRTVLWTSFGGGDDPADGGQGLQLGYNTNPLFEGVFYTYSAQGSNDAGRYLWFGSYPQGKLMHVVVTSNGSNTNPTSGISIYLNGRRSRDDQSLLGILNIVGPIRPSAVGPHANMYLHGRWSLALGDANKQPQKTERIQVFDKELTSLEAQELYYNINAARGGAPTVPNLFRDWDFSAHAAGVVPELKGSGFDMAIQTLGAQPTNPDFY